MLYYRNRSAIRIGVCKAIRTGGKERASVSFSSEIKEELSRLSLGGECCVLSELAALMLSCGSIKLSSRGMGVSFATETLLIARRISDLVERLFGVSPVLEQHERHRLNRYFRYLVEVEGDAARRLVDKTGVLGEGSHGVEPSLVRKSCDRNAYMRGLFLGCGSMNHPSKGYHMEFVLENRQAAEGLQQLLHGCEISARMMERSGRTVVYIKDGQGISDFLAFSGAHGALLEYENVRAMRDLRNNVNRMVNCETANMEKLSDAAARQIQFLDRIMESERFINLPQDLQETAMARINNPEASLQELAEELGVSKSGVRHRLKRLEELAEG